MNPWIPHLLRAGGGGGGAVLPPTGRTMLANLKSSLILDEGTGGPTWSRATKAWGFNELGYLEELASGCAFFGGARLVRNTVRTTSEDFSNAAWSKIGSVTAPSANVLVCANATSQQYINQTTGGTALVIGQKTRYGIRVKRVVGGADFIQMSGQSTTHGTGQFVNISLADGTYSATGCSPVVTSLGNATYDISVVFTCVAAGSDVFNIAFTNALSSTRLASFIGDGIKSFEILRAWSVDVTNYDASYIPEYVSVGVLSSPYHGAGTTSTADGCKYFETDWQGAPLPAASLLGFRREAAATNNLLQCRNLTQNAWGSLANGGVGSELLTNGVFADATDWTRSGAAYWSVSGGVLNLSAADSSASYYDNSQIYAALVTGKQYIVEFDYVHTSGAAPTITLRGSDAKAIGNSTGRKTVTVTCGASVAGYGIRIGTFAAGVATIDNITIKEAPVQCAQTATGLDGIANTATTLTATAADAIILQPTSGIASAARCASAYVKRRTGTGTISFTQDGTNWTDITALINASTWSRVQITSTLANPTVGFKISTSGDAIDVDVVQNEAGAVATSPLVTTTATVSRNADSLTYPTASNIDLAASTVYCGFGAVGNYYSGYPIAIDSSGRIIYAHAADTKLGNYDGVNIAFVATVGYLNGGRVKCASAWGGSTKNITVDGSIPVSGAFDGSMGASTVINIGGIFSAAGPAYIGPIAIYNYQMTDAELQALTT